jgi:hypothetical protein
MGKLCDLCRSGIPRRLKIDGCSEVPKDSPGWRAKHAREPGAPGLTLSSIKEYGRVFSMSLHDIRSYPGGPGRKGTYLDERRTSACDH